jgi:nucleotide-binding universal stress UspA family protein
VFFVTFVVNLRMAIYNKIIVPLDRSYSDPVILGHVRELARVSGASIVLIHVADGFVARNQERLNLRESQEMREDREYLEELVRQFSADGFEASFVLEQGEPARRILEVVKREGCDLIAMATHGHRFIADFLLGSVADRIRHDTDVPVLMVRAQKP